MPTPRLTCASHPWARRLALLAAGFAAPALAQVRILPLGDSITNGGQGYVSYRYDLWFDLLAGGYGVDFVGSRSDLFDGDPIPSLYPDYFTTFDRQHEGYWGWRTDQIDAVIAPLAQAAQPDIVLMHLGSNDVGQSGAAGVANADFYLRSIINRIRGVNPSAVILIAQIIPIGPGTSYFDNSGWIPALNAAVAELAADLSTPLSPVVAVDHFTGFDLGTMMQPDGLHPNELGEAFQSGRWQAALLPFLTAGNIAPNVALTAPAGGATFTAPTSVPLAAAASDVDGIITAVRFFAGATLLATDTTEPYEFLWTNVAVGPHVLTAVAEDDAGATRISAAAAIRVLAPGDWTPIAVTNPSFETPILGDGQLAEGPGVIGGWTFDQSPLTYTGIFNPPEGSYPGAEGAGTPSGADAANAAYLFKNGPDQSVELRQTLAETLSPGTDYRVRVAIGRFLPNQPYAFSTYGGYAIELRAGDTVIAGDSDSVSPPVGQFTDAIVAVTSGVLDPQLVGQPLSLRLTISALDWPRSSHFDYVRIDRRPTPHPPPGDVDGDFDVDSADAQRFLDCIAGPASPVAPVCLPGDLDADGDVDAADLSDFQRLL